MSLISTYARLQRLAAHSPGNQSVDNTHLRPKQFLEPMWKGWKASLLSDANFSSPMNLSGWNPYESLKYFSLWLMAHW